MNVRVPVSTSEPAFSLCLLDDLDRPAPQRLAGIGVVSVLANCLLLLGLATLASIEGTPPPPEAHPIDVSRSTPLVFPRELTQKEPNRAEITRQIHLDDLVNKSEVTPQKRIFTPPPIPKAAPQPPVPAPTLEPPSIKMSQAAPPALGNVPNAVPSPVPPPQAPPQEKPKLAFETPGLQSASPSPRPGGLGKIAPPKATIDEAIRNVTRGGPGGVVVGDMPDEPGLGQTLGQAPAPGRQASQVELLSDPLGIDFKPYLIRVLTAVKRNWLAVIPESARLGRRGKVVIQFSINKAGAVPKLVIAMPSGTEAFDRAGVAGISASNPFPPLPADFRGDQIRVQLVFFYNVPSR